MAYEKMTSLSWMSDLYRMSQVDTAPDAATRIEQRVLEHIVSGFECDNGCLAMPDSDIYDQLIIVAGIGFAAGMIGSTLQASEGVLGRVAHANKPLLHNEDIPGAASFGGEGGSESLSSSTMCWPLRLPDQTIGALSVSRGTGAAPFTQEDLERGAAIVNMITLVIENMRLHQDHRERIAALTESEARFQCTFDQAAVGITHAAPGGLLLRTNQKFCDIMGYDGGELLQLRYQDIIHHEDVLDSVELHQELEQGLREAYSHEKRYVRKDGEIVWVRVSVSMVRDAEGKPKYSIGVIEDILERKQAEEALQRTNDDLKAINVRLQEAQNHLLQSEKMASIGQLAAGVAHEINDPIGNVYSNLDTLQRCLQQVFGLLAAYESAEGSLAPEALATVRALKHKAGLEFLRKDVGSLMEESREGITRVKKIVQDLKDFSHAGTQEEWQWADLHKGLDSTLNIVNNEIKYKAQMVKRYGDLPEVLCLPAQLNQVFMNLLVNAAHAIEERGEIRLSSGVSGKEVWVEVADTGKGIAPEHLGRIFDPFFTTKAVGTGLGLSLSYGIVQKHNGRIEVRSEPGKGATFRVWLPVNRVGTGQSVGAQAA